MDKTKIKIAGVDGCKAGWIAIKHTIGTGFFEPVLFLSFDLLCIGLKDYDVIAVDMPVVLSTSPSRFCDIQARKLLAKRASTIFSAPPKQILAAKTYQEANTLSKTLFDKGISKQAWFLFPKIQQVQKCLKENPRIANQLFECHPELSFKALNQEQVMLNSKKTKLGKMLRSQLIEEAFEVDLERNFLNTFLKRDVADDDIIDAFACLWTARRLSKGGADSIGDTEKIVY